MNKINDLELRLRQANKEELREIVRVYRFYVLGCGGEELINQIEETGLKAARVR